ncbi:hypothetical protein IWX49DRAFT_50633 [Phyllosticta citricarpa]
MAWHSMAWCGAAESESESKLENRRRWDTFFWVGWRQTGWLVFVCVHLFVHFSSLLFSSPLGGRTDGLIPHTHTVLRVSVALSLPCCCTYTHASFSFVYLLFFFFFFFSFFFFSPCSASTGWQRTDGRTDGRRDHACMGWRLA